jgi:hypothetical protein
MPDTLSGLTLEELAPSAFRVFAMLQAVPEPEWEADYQTTESGWLAVGEWAIRFSDEDPGDGEGVRFADLAEKARAIFLLQIGVPAPFDSPMCDLIAWEAVARHLFGAIQCEPNEKWKLAQTEATWPAWASRRAAAAAGEVQS